MEANTQTDRRNGWLALSPLAVFLGTYLVSSIAAKDFYSVPVTSAFLIASIYAILITKGKIADRISIFSTGAGDKNVLLMIWIFMMAGAFASTAKAIGSVEATVNLTLTILPAKLVLAGLFLASCFISMSIGTSVGTIVALTPIASGIATQAGFPLPMTTALIVGGAFFGDNLSFISDTTIAATTSQGCSMADKFRTNIWIAGPAALVVTVIYIAIGMNNEAVPSIGQIDFFKLIPYLTVIILALCGINVLTVLSTGLALCAVIGFADGMTWAGFLGSVGSGITGMGELIIVTMLAGGMLEIIRHNGGIDFIIRGLTRRINGRKGAEFSIGTLVGLSNLCTANNTIAILTVGKIARNISERYGLDPRKSASILDTFSCVVQSIIPYGAQLLMASSLAGLTAASIIPWLFYPMALLVTACLSILVGFSGRKSSEESQQ
ncbi:MAG: Na+/H+ antiporter NhaC family protein [Bacteroidales bacterium]|nr:Na+/H+ antiporter NhaC family protein [Bacteroidales bacterium]